MRASGIPDEKGFTLIELLVVVAIIGILAAIATPSLMTGQQRARYAQAAADTRNIVVQSQVVTGDYNQVPVAQLNIGAANDPSFLWTQPTPVGLPQLPVYMPPVDDPWMPGSTNYQFNEAPAAGPACGAAATPGCVIFAAWTQGGNSSRDWDGLAAPATMNDDLGNSSVQGCVSGPGVPVAAPC